MNQILNGAMALGGFFLLSRPVNGTLAKLMFRVSGVALAAFGLLRAFGIVGNSRGVPRRPDADSPGTPKRSSLKPLPQSGAVVRVLAGNNILCVNSTAGSGSNTPDQVTLREPIYALSNVKTKTAGIVKSALFACMDDFNAIQSKTHGGAFGADMEVITGDRLSEFGFEQRDKRETFMLFWKIPGEIQKIGTYQRDQSLLFNPDAVGTYQLLNDSGDGVVLSGFGQWVNGKQAEKEAFIYSREENAIANLSKIHCLRLVTEEKRNKSSNVTGESTSDEELTAKGMDPSDHGRRFAGISNAFFFDNFDGPKDPELEKVRGMLQTIRAAGWGVHMCNGWQHQIVIYSYQDKPITAQEFADLLADNDNEDVKTFMRAFTEAAAPSGTKEDGSPRPEYAGNVPRWRELFIEWGKWSKAEKEKEAASSLPKSS